MYEELTGWEKALVWPLILTAIVVCVVCVVLLAPFVLLEKLGLLGDGRRA